MATPNTNVSVVDYLNSTGKASDYNSRATMAKTYGIANYAGTAEQNTQLLGLLKGGSSNPATSPVTTSNVNDKINSDQTKNFSDASSSDTPQTKSSSSNYADIFSQVSGAITSNLPAKPAEVNLTNTYNNLRASSGVADLESNLSTLQAQARDIQAISASRTAAEKGKAVPMNVISGRVTEEETQDNARLTAVNNSIQTITSQLQMKYNTIDNVMKYTGQDYSNAVDSYDKQFSNNLSIMNTVKGIIDSQNTLEEQQKDDARANLQIIYNSMPANGIADTTQQAYITKLELQAGLPAGFYENITSKNPKADVLSTTTRDVNGVKYADVIMKNADGSLTTKSVKLGGVDKGTGGKATEGELLRNAVAGMGKDLTSMKVNGYVSVKDYQSGKETWVNGSGRTGEEYDNAFKGYLTTDDAYSLGLIK